MVLKKRKSSGKSHDLNHIAYFNRGVQEDAIYFNLIGEPPVKQNYSLRNRFSHSKIKNLFKLNLSLKRGRKFRTGIAVN